MTDNFNNESNSIDDEQLVSDADADAKSSENSISRRSFVKTAGVAAGVVALCAVVGSALWYSGEQKEEQSKSQVNSDSAEDDPTLSSTQVNGKTLVAYFSAQGHTRAVAQTIADELDANMFEIAPVEAYSETDLDWNNSQSRVKREHDDESLRNVTLQVTNPEKWADYASIVVCYPIWWDAAPWYVNTFMTENDFAGKKVYPVCTSSYSGIENSVSALNDMVRTGDWQAGKRFDSNATDSEVQAWADTIQ